MRGWYELIAAELGGLEILKQKLLEFVDLSHSEHYISLEDMLALEPCRYSLSPKLGAYICSHTRWYLSLE